MSIITPVVFVFIVVGCLIPYCNFDLFNVFYIELEGRDNVLFYIPLPHSLDIWQALNKLLLI